MKIKHCSKCKRRPRASGCLCKSCRRKEDARVKEAKRNGTYVCRVRQPRLNDEERSRRKEEIREYHKKYRKAHWEDLKVQKRKYAARIRQEGIAAYGGRCSCCGEDIHEFLTLEHVNGRREDEKGLTGQKAWAKLKAGGWPKIGYTILCFNCNCAKGAYGQCPHEKQRSSEELTYSVGRGLASQLSLPTSTTK